MLYCSKNTKTRSVFYFLKTRERVFYTLVKSHRLLYIIDRVSLYSNISLNKCPYLKSNIFFV